jgi:flavin-binding protein dodecin
LRDPRHSRRAIFAAIAAKTGSLSMTANTYKLIELVGSSPTSTDDAIRNAIQKASATVKHIDWFQVVETRGHVATGSVAHFQVTLKVGFRIE